MIKLLIAIAILLAGGTESMATESAQVAKGKALYVEFCQRCHGADGQRGEGTRTPIWGPGAPRDKFKTVQELFEYLQFLMPFDKPESVTDEQRWHIIAYMMVQHGVLKSGDTLEPAKAATITIVPPAEGTPAPSTAIPQPSPPSTPGGAIPGSAEAGEAVFRQCRACHEVGPGAKSKLGPALNGIIGRKAGTVEGFNYSPANKAAGEKGLTWTESELATYLADPRKFMPGNRMAFVGVRNERDRANLIAYLKSVSE
jgi:cytochrome c